MILNEYISTYYQDKINGFKILFKQFTDNYVDNIDYQVLIKQLKSSMDNEAYERNLKREFKNIP